MNLPKTRQQISRLGVVKCQGFWVRKIDSRSITSAKVQIFQFLSAISKCLIVLSLSSKMQDFFYGERFRAGAKK